MQDTKLDDAIGKVKIALFNAQLHLLPSTLVNMQRAMQTEKDLIASQKLALICADVARTINQSAVAAAMLDGVLGNPAAGATAMMLFQAAKRLRVKIHLDALELDQAMALAETIDSLEVESAAFLKKDSEMVVVTRRDVDITVETWLLLCEAYCAVSDTEKAQESLANARQRLFSDEGRLSQADLTLIERTAAQKRIADYRHEIEFWEIVIRLKRDEPQSRELLAGFISSLESQLKSDKRLLARAYAVAGNWQLYEVPPAGIGLAEAVRLYESCQPVAAEMLALGSAQEIVMPKEITPAPVAESLSLAPASSFPVQSIDAPLAEILLQNQTQISVLTNLCRQLLEKSSSEHAPASENAAKSRSLAGGLDKVMLPSLLELALESRQTGYFEVTWEPEDLESSILAKLISPRARSGRCFIFIQNTTITDVTLGNYEPEAGKQYDERDVEEALSIIVQISLSIGIDTAPSGYVFFRHSPAVALRQPRVLWDKNKVIDIVVALDTQMNEMSSGDFDAAESLLPPPPASSLAIDSEDILEIDLCETDCAEEEIFPVLAAL